MKVVKYIVGMFLAFQALALSVHFGSYWQSQACPSRVIVTLDSGKQVAGDLSVSWNGDWMLNTADSEIKVADFQSMTFKGTVYQNAQTNTSLLHTWRAILPMTLVGSIILTILGWVLVIETRRAMNDPKT